MKRKILAFSLIGNVALAALLVWTRTAHTSEYNELARAAMRGDELHIRLHAKSLAALEDAVDVPETREALRLIVATGEANIADRERVGLGR